MNLHDLEVFFEFAVSISLVFVYVLLIVKFNASIAKQAILLVVSCLKQMEWQ